MPSGQFVTGRIPPDVPRYSQAFRARLNTMKPNRTNDQLDCVQPVSRVSLRDPRPRPVHERHSPPRRNHNPAQ